MANKDFEKWAASQYPYAAMRKQFEGYSDKVYPGAVYGEPTVGYGFNLNDEQFKNTPVSDILKNAETLFYKRYQSARFDAGKFVGEDVFNSLSPKRQAVLTDMAYNMGLGGLSKFKKMKDALISGDYKKAAYEMVDSDWFNQVGNRSKALVKMMESD